jgi:hypothetical protein
MSHESYPRKRLFVDRKIQGALVRRVVMYWATCLITIVLMLLSWRILTGPHRLLYAYLSELWFYFAPALLASFILLPAVIIDVVRLSNRFVGPLNRLRQSMRALAQGEDVEPIRFRKADFWQTFADEFNAIAARVQAGRLAPKEDAIGEDDLVGTEDLVGTDV